jgi:hypothetical protein
MGEDFSASNKAVHKSNSKLIFFFLSISLFLFVVLFLPRVSMIEFLSYPKIRRNACGYCGK